MTKRTTKSRQSTARADSAELVWREAVEARRRTQVALDDSTPAVVETARAALALHEELVAWGRGQRSAPPPRARIEDAERKEALARDVQDDLVARSVAAIDRAGNLGAEAGQAAIEARAALRESAREAARRPRKPQVMARRRALLDTIRRAHPEWKEEAVAFELAEREGLPLGGAVGRMRRALQAKP